MFARRRQIVHGFFVGGLVILAGFFAPITVASAIDMATWSAPVSFSAAGQTTLYPEMAASSDNTKVLAVWIQSEYNLADTVWTSRSSDGGATWAAPVALTTTAAGTDAQNAYFPKVAMSSDGQKATVVWYQNNGTSLVIYARSTADGGATWATAITVSTTNTGNYYPDIAMSSDGTRATVVWYSWSGVGTKYIVRTSSTSNSGSTWSAPVDLSDTSKDSNDPQVNVSSDGTKVAATWNLTTGYSGVQVRVSSNGGSSWGAITALSATDRTAYEQQVSVSSDGTKLTAVWARSNGTNYVIQSSTSSNGGTSWGTPVSISATGQHAHKPQIAASSDASKMSLVWQRSDGVNTIVQSSSSSDSGATWTTPVNLSAAGQSADDPRIAASSDGVIAGATWWRSNGSYYIVQSAVTGNSGATWSSATDLSATGNNALYPMVSIASNGSQLTVVWRRGVMQGTKGITTNATYSVTYNSNGSTSGAAPTDASGPYLSGASATVLGNTGALTRTGYAFVGWNTAANGTGTTYAPAATLPIASNTTLYAMWAPTYTLTYNSNSSTSGSAPSDGSSPYLAGATATVLGNSGTLAKTGYTFTGWNTTANGTGTAYAPGASLTMGSANATLFAQWAPVTSTISYDANGATSGSAPADGTYTTDATAYTVLGSSGLHKTGYTFTGWNTTANGTGTAYAAGDHYSTSSSITLFAQWTINNYTLSFDGNGNTSGTAPTDPSSPYDYNTNATVIDSGTLAKTGYTFTGWNTTANGTGTAYATGDPLLITENTQLFAQWSRDPEPAPSQSASAQPTQSDTPPVAPVPSEPVNNLGPFDVSLDSIQDGDFVAVDDAQALDIRTSAGMKNTSVNVTSPAWKLEFADQLNDGHALPLGSRGTLRLVPSTQLYVHGHGYLPNSEVVVYLLPDNLLLGRITVALDGTFAGTVAVPATHGTGRHIAQANGYAADGHVLSYSLGVEVAQSSDLKRFIGTRVNFAETSKKIGAKARRTLTSLVRQVSSGRAAKAIVVGIRPNARTGSSQYLLAYQRARATTKFLRTAGLHCAFITGTKAAKRTSALNAQRVQITVKLR